MNERKIGFVEGYRLARKAELDPISSVFIALVWVLRGVKVKSK